MSRNGRLSGKALRQRATDATVKAAEHDENVPIETIPPLAPPLLFDDEGHLVDPHSLTTTTRHPLTIMSPPLRQPPQQSPFCEPDVDRRARTPMYELVDTTTASFPAAIKDTAIAAATTTVTQDDATIAATTKRRHWNHPSLAPWRHSTDSTYGPPQPLRESDASSSAATLFGEGIALEDDDDDDEEEQESMISSVMDSQMEPSNLYYRPTPATTRRQRRVSFDIETGIPPTNPTTFLHNSSNTSSSSDYSDVYSDMSVNGGHGLATPADAAISPTSSSSISDNVSSVSSLSNNPSGREEQQQQQQRHIAALIKQWGTQLNQEIIRSSHITTNELSNLLRMAREGILMGIATVSGNSDAAASSPTSAQLLENLHHLQHIHREKVEQLTNYALDEHDDHFDFALVLTPQAVYEFWADLLDFRVEQLGQENDQDNGGCGGGGTDKDESSPETLGTQDTEESSDDVVAAAVATKETIDSRPFLTPLTGIRRRRGRFSNDEDMSSSSTVKDTPKPIPHTAPARHRGESSTVNRLYSSSMMSVSGSGRRTVKPRMSMFERAVGPGGFSPSMRPSFGSRKNLFDSAASSALTPNSAAMDQQTPFTFRRRWGNRNLALAATDGAATTPDVMSPPVRALLRRHSSLKKRHVQEPGLSARSTPFQEDDQVMLSGKRQKCSKNCIRIEDIPSQVIPRGIAARTNGMMQFLSALKRGIVVRRHRPGAEALFCRILSTDGGDTIKYQHIDDVEAMLAFKEQRVRYNRRRHKMSSPSGSRSTEPRSIEKRWSQKQLTDESDELQTFSLPDYIAAKQYRQKLLKEQVGVSKKMTDLATKVANSGIVRVADIVAVHPARHEDPRSESGELGTASLRRSKSEYHSPHAFSLVTRAGRSLGKGKLSNSDATEKWHAGEGTDTQFKFLDLEAATEGEYWLIFRGFLLLHRDAYAGRFASQRAAGFGSNYTGVETEYNSLETEPAELVLHKDEFREPPTVSNMERIVARMRRIDTSYMEGHVAPGAIPPPSDYFLGFSSPGTQIWSRLRQAGLETQRIYALDTKRVMIKVRCPADRLTDVAEVLRLKLKTRNGSFAPFRENALAMFRPLNDAFDTPSSLGAAASLFRSSDRQTIIDYIIRSRIRDSGAELGETTDLGKLIAARVPLHMHEKLDSLYNVWFYFWRKSSWEGRDGRSMSVERNSASRSLCAPSSMFGSEHMMMTTDGGNADEDESHETSRVKPVPNFFTRLVVGSLYQPLDSVEQYFGEQVAFYFAWLQHSAFHLAFLSVAGLIVFMCQMISGVWDHWIRPVFAMIVMVWSFIVMVNWRKRSNFLAHRWGTMDYKEQETTRPQFKGEYRRDEISQEWVVYYPKWKRWLKYLISFPITLAFTVGTLILILLIHANRDQLLARYINSLGASGSSEFNIDFSVKAIGQQKPVNSIQITRDLLRDSTFWFLMAGLPALLGLCLPLLNFILMRVSLALNDFENYRTESEYRTHLIIKVFSFRFVCYFATLYYYAFLSTGTIQAIENGILRVGTGVFIYITVSHWWGVALQVFFPLSVRKVRLYFQKKQLRDELKMIELEENELEPPILSEEESDDEAKERRIALINRRLLLDQAQDEVWEEAMLPMHDSFPEYIQAVILFAYVACFSVVLPITPFICLINHLLSMRLDAYKVCKGRRRPLPHKTGGIGVWEHVLHIVTVIAVLTNCWLMGFTNASIYSLSALIGPLGIFAVVVGWEHIMLLLKYVMQTSISHLPKSVREEMKKEEYRMAKKRNSSLRRKNGRRSKLKRESSRMSTSSSLFDSGARSRSSKTRCSSSSRYSHSKSVHPSTDDRELYAINSSTVSESTSPAVSRRLSSLSGHIVTEAKQTNNQTGDAHSSMRGIESPFEAYAHSYQTPQGQPDPNMCALLGRGLDSNGSLATPENEAGTSFRATIRKENMDETNNRAAERISRRLSRLEEKRRSRHDK